MRELKPLFTIQNPQWKNAMVRLDTDPNAHWGHFGEVGYVAKEYASVLAAAPELLRALKLQMCWTMRDGSPCCCPAGENELDEHKRSKKMPTLHSSRCQDSRDAIAKATGAADK
jgi:hypothetical protein